VECLGEVAAVGCAVVELGGHRGQVGRGGRGRFGGDVVDAAQHVVDAAIPEAKPDSQRLSTSLDEIIARRAEFLTGYQDAAYARRYTDFVAKVRGVAIGAGLNGALDRLCPGGDCSGYIPPPSDPPRKAILFLTDGVENVSPCLDPAGGALRPDRARPGHGLELKREDAERYAG